MDKYTNSNINLEEYIRLYDVKEPVIIDTADLVIAQEEEITFLQSKIEEYECLVNSLDIEAIEQYLDALWIVEDNINNNYINKLQTILDNYKERQNSI